METKNDALSARVRQIGAISEALRQKIAEEVIPTSSELRLAVESVALRIEDARKLGQNKATVLELTEGVDFWLPMFTYRLISDGPLRAWLSEKAALIYTFCDIENVNVSIEPFTSRVAKTLKSGITIEWTELAEFDASEEDAKIPLLDILKNNRIEYPTIHSDCVSRTDDVIAHAPQIMATIQNAIDEGVSTVKVFEEPNGTPWELRGRLVGDVKTFCELLGLNAQVVDEEFENRKWEIFHSPRHVLVSGLL